LPTFADLVETKLNTPHDGISIMPTLLGKTQSERTHLYWEFYYNANRPGKKALRHGDWKLISNQVWASGPENFELYNIVKDPSENSNLAQAYPEKVAELSKLMKSSHQPSEIFKFGEKKKNGKK
jgi:arylsulfatase A-like enzyme